MDLSDALEDRREALRQPSKELELEVTFENGIIGCATLRDLSRTGVRFRMSKWLNIHSYVTLHPPAGSGLDACEVEIMRGYEVDDGGEKAYEFGARFKELTGSNRHQWFLSLRKAA
jgi:hypothetical protein